MHEDSDTYEPNEVTPQPSEATTYVLDRFEDGGWAVLEDEAGHTFNVPRFWLPGELSEGDVVVVEQQEIISEDEAGFAVGYRGLDIYVDSDATAARREHARNFRDRLPKGPSGDLDL